MNNKSEIVDTIKNKSIFNQHIKKIIFIYSVSIVIFVVALVNSFLLPDQYRQIFTLNEDVIFALNMSINIFIYSIPPFLIGMLGSITRILITTNNPFENHVRLVLGSGLIGILTFLSFKSGLFLDLFIPNVVSVSTAELTDQQLVKSFYKLIVVCFLAGMFSTAIFLTIEERVNSLLSKSSKN